MTSEPIRDPRGDHMLTPQNCALVITGHQPTQVTSIRSMDQDMLAGGLDSRGIDPGYVLEPAPPGMARRAPGRP
jgi:hypothetical protein